VQPQGPREGGLEGVLENPEALHMALPEYILCEDANRAGRMQRIFQNEDEP
jgi:hypothetical protein